MNFPIEKLTLTCRFRCYLLLCLSLLLVAGCSDSNWGRVTGNVTLDGEPVGPGTLMFEPADGKGPTVIGHLSDDGSYSLRSGEKVGAAVGDYKVTIIGTDAGAMNEEMAAAQSARKNPIPSQYANTDAGLTATVAAGDQEINFDLEQKKRRRG